MTTNEKTEVINSIRESRKFHEGVPDNFFLSSIYFTEGRKDLLQEAIGPLRKVRTSISKETYSHLWFSRRGGGGSGSPVHPPPLDQSMDWTLRI